MQVDFNLMTSAPMRAVLRVLGDDALFFWPLRRVRLSQQWALCNICVVVTAAEQDAYEMLCPKVGVPFAGDEHYCTHHTTLLPVCVQCGRPLHPGFVLQEQCLRCFDTNLRRSLRVGPLPQRFQWRRVTGARTPRDAIEVTRRSPWGNPFAIVHQRALLPKYYRQRYKHRQLADVAVLLFEAYYERNAKFREEVRDCLAGRDLKCFCPLDWPCHADVLLRWANAPQGGHV